MSEPNKEQASETAVLAALARASAVEDTRFPEPGGDTLVRKLLPASARRLLWPIIRGFMRWALGRRMPGAYGFVYARTRVIDEHVRQAIAEGATQLIIVGAGLDTRALRFAKPGLTVFEVDQVLTQVFKRERLVAAKIDPTGNGTRYVSYDFNRGRLIDVLMSQGFKREERTCIVAEGFTFYVKPPVIYSLLGFLSGDCAPGSTIAFDYIDAATAEGTTKDKWAKRTRKEVAKRGEPFQFGIHFGSLGEHLEPMGLTVIRDYHAEELEQAYGLPITEHPALKIGRFYGLCIARR
jgi:methyltransferase (TIGR00027 family)